MKITILYTILLTAAHAAQVAVTNNQAASSVEVFSSSGGSLDGIANVSLGYFSSLTDSQISTSASLGYTVGSLNSDFVTFGTATSGINTTSFFGATWDNFTVDSGFVDVTTAPDDSFVGRNIYMLITSSADAFVYKFDEVYPTDNPTPTPTQNLTFGSAGDTGTTLLGSANAGGFNSVVLVPEPTSAALAGLAGLAFLVRRRRA